MFNLSIDQVFSVFQYKNPSVASLPNFERKFQSLILECIRKVKRGVWSNKAETVNKMAANKEPGKLMKALKMYFMFVVMYLKLYFVTLSIDST